MWLASLHRYVYSFVAAKTLIGVSPVTLRLAATIYDTTVSFKTRPTVDALAKQYPEAGIAGPLKKKQASGGSRKEVSLGPPQGTAYELPATDGYFVGCYIQTTGGGCDAGPFEITEYTSDGDKRIVTADTEFVAQAGADCNNNNDVEGSTKYVVERNACFVSMCLSRAADSIRPIGV